MIEHDNNMRRNFFTVFFSLLILLILGMFGYALIEGWSWLDALYMTVIAFSTVGFQEDKSLGLYGRIFTIFIILFGLVLLSMMSASVTSLLVRRELLPGFKKRKLKKIIASAAPAKPAKPSLRNSSRRASRWSSSKRMKKYSKSCGNCFQIC